ncbi:MAG: response regulator receiver protein [Parcubacteria group bacterium Gr01-1014_29]|nr:MAG: response regulator receiver protein [Parcubacteria group bacterium Gr01-1014_29]
MVGTKGKKVLIVDDEPVLRTVAMTYFQQSGYEAKGAPDAAAGLELAESWRPDVILLDIIMPGINGLELLHTLKTDPLTKNIPVFIFSNLDSEDEIAQALDMGAAGYLTKANYSLEDVQKKVEEVLQKKDMG